MPVLDLEINCLCFYARDELNQELHVLMPGTNGHEGHDGHNGHADHKHVVRMFHRSFKGPNEQKSGRSMEGWALVLGDEKKGSADLSLALKPKSGASPNGSAAGQQDEAKIVNLSDLTNALVDRTLVGNDPGDKVAARITLRSGEITNLVSEATWVIGGQKVSLAHQVTWRIKVPHKLKWVRLHPKDVPAGHDAHAEKVPLESLAQLKPEEDLSYRLAIYHVTEASLPPTSGALLKPEVMKAHYRALFPLLGIDDPGEDLLPQIATPGTDGVHCAPAGGTVKIP